MRIIKLLSDEKHKQTTEEKPEYITEYGTHFNEHYARKAVANMQNEDNTVGPHWTVEETTALANQVGVNLKDVSAKLSLMRFLLTKIQTFNVTSQKK